MEVSNDEASTTSASKPTSDPQWCCDFTNCGKTFTHRYKLKYEPLIPSNVAWCSMMLTWTSRHRKRHVKAYRCLEPGCVSQGVGFADMKDLMRHHSKHNGRQFYCSFVTCPHALGGTGGGYTRKDNLIRHGRVKHDLYTPKVTKRAVPPKHLRANNAGPQLTVL